MQWLPNRVVKNVLVPVGLFQHNLTCAGIIGETNYSKGW